MLNTRRYDVEQKNVLSSNYVKGEPSQVPIMTF